MTMLWAGKQLTIDDEIATISMASFLRRCGDTVGAEKLERFLPRHDSKWTPDQLEAGAHVGPWTDFEAGI